MLTRTCQRLELRILPFETRVLFVDSDFRILRFANSPRQDFVYVESFGGAHVFKAKPDLKRFDEHWEALHAATLSTDDSKDLLSKLCQIQDV